MPVLSKHICASVVSKSQRGTLTDGRRLLRSLIGEVKSHVRTSSIKSTTATTGQQKSEASLTERGKAVATHVRYRSNTAPLQAIDDSILDVEETVESSIKPFEDIPGPASRSIIRAMIDRLPGGRLHNIDLTISNRLLYEQYGPIVKETIGNLFTVVHLFDPVDVETVYRNDGKIPQRHAFFMLETYNKRRSNDVQGLLTSHDDHWTHLRKNVQQKMLRPKAVSAYISDQSIVGDDMIEQIEQMMDENGDVADMRDTIYKYATECIGVVCFNIRLGALRSHSADSETSIFISAVKTVMDISHNEFQKFPFYKWFNSPTFNRMAKAQEIIRGMASKYSEQAVQSKQGEEISGEEGDLVPYLIAKTSLSKPEVLTVISEFIFAGVDTTSHYLLFALHALARHPEKQEILAAEINKIVERSDVITPQQMGRMPYLRAVLKETLRYLPVAPGNCRTITKDVVCSGYLLPKGTFTAMHNDLIQKQDSYFEAPEEFVPERWLRDQDQKLIHPFAALPFGFGSRSCIGKRFAEQEVSLALIKILKNYRVESHQKDLKLVKGITYTPVEPMKMRFIHR